MRILMLILGMALLGAVADVYIYRRVVRRRLGRRGRRAYIIGCLAFDLLAVGALLLFRYGPIDTPTLVTMWTVALFFAHVVPGVVYMFLSLPNGKFFQVLGAVTGLAMLAMMVWGMSFGRTSLRVNEIEIVSDQLPASFDGLRVVQFSDLHLGTLPGEKRFVERVVETINALQPDIVVQSGDIVNMHAGELDQQAMQQLMKIEARHGVFAAIGNHDLGFYMDNEAMTPAASIRQLIDKQRDMGWNVLIDQTEYLHAGSDSIAISGVGFPAHDPTIHPSSDVMTGADLAATYATVNQDVFDITIAHTPNLWDEIRATGKADLTLAGHVHAMQMKLFGWSPARWMYRWWSGLYEHDGQRLYVNDGLGCVAYPMRINARPEITLFILRRS